MKIFSAQLKGTTTVATGSNVSLTGSFSGSIAGIDINSTNTFTASLFDTNTFTSSTSARLNSIETTSASNIARLNEVEIVSASNISRINSLETTSASVDSLNTIQNNRLTYLEIKTGSLATTGSNTFIGTQTITGSLFISANLIVQGTSSLENITASAVSIGTNIVNLNTANPAIRYAGLVIGDSGSVGGSGSFLYDSVQDEMIFVHRGTSTVVTSSVVLMGPQTFDALGTETYPTSNIIQKGTGNEHLVDSCIFDNGTTTCVKNNFVSTGTGLFCGQLNAITGVFGNKGGGSCAILITDNDQSNVRLRFTNSGPGGQSMSIVGGNPGASNAGLAFYDETNTTTRLYISSTGCVGINTNNPQSLFDVQNCINTPYTSTNTLVSNQWFRTSNPSTCPGATSGILFVAAGPGGGNGIATINGVTTSCGSMTITFGTRHASGAITERMRIVSNGTIGIGTDNPTLHTSGDIGGLVVKGVGGRGIIEVHDGNSSGKAVFQQINGTTYLGNLDKATGTGELQLLVDGQGSSATAAMVLTRCGHIVVNNGPNSQADYGRFTISTSTPKTSDPNTQEKTVLHLSTCEADTPFGMKFQIVGGACNCTRAVTMQTGDHYISNQGNITMQVSGGNVGIGTSLPNARLEVLDNSTSAGEVARFQRNIDQLNEYAYIKVGNASYPAYFGAMLSTYDIGYMSMSPNPTDGKALAIRTTDGNVGIGTVSPFAKLTVNGTIANSSAAGNDNYTIDTMNAYQSIANGGWVDFNGMSGFLMVNNWSNGATTLFALGGGNTSVVGTVTGTAGTTHHNPSVGGYRWCNNYGQTANFGFQVFRTRNTA